MSDTKVSTEQMTDEKIKQLVNQEAKKQKMIDKKKAKNAELLARQGSSVYAFKRGTGKMIIGLVIGMVGYILGGLGALLYPFALFFCFWSLKILLIDLFFFHVSAPFRQIHRFFTKTQNEGPNVYYDEVYKRHVKYQTKKDLILYGIIGRIIAYSINGALLSLIFFFRPYDDGCRLTHITYENQDVVYGFCMTPFDWQIGHAQYTDDEGYVHLITPSGEEDTVFALLEVHGEYVPQKEFREIVLLSIKNGFLWVFDYVKFWVTKIIHKLVASF